MESDIFRFDKMSNVSCKISNLLEKMASNDKDFRYMATNDLITELKKDNIKLDDETERNVVKILLQLLEDKNSEVQNLAVKCLGPLVKKVKHFHLEIIVNNLCCNMLMGDESIRDISSIGLKNVISELPRVSSSLAVKVCLHITNQLNKENKTPENISIQLEVLDILADLFARFSCLLIPYHTAILHSLLPHLKSPRQAIRKRVIDSLGYMNLSCNPELNNELMNYLLEGISNNVNTYIQCIAAIYRNAGHRLGGFIDRIVPIIINYSSSEDDEIKERCFQVFEVFIYRCPKEIGPHIDNITQLCLTYISYDPNYNYNSVMDDEDEDEDMSSDDSEDEESGLYSDDDDISWKVRRSTIKCIQAIITTRRELFPDLYHVITPVLISSLKEREENVKFEIFKAYLKLLQQTKAAIIFNAKTTNQEDLNSINVFQVQIPIIIKALLLLIKDKKPNTRLNCFDLFKELAILIPGSLANDMNLIIAGIKFSFEEKNSNTNIKIETLSFLMCLFETHSAEVFHPHINNIIPLVLKAVNNPFYKISSGGLMVLQELIVIMRPLNENYNFDSSEYLKDIYHCTFGKLETLNIDQEVKEKAISCMGFIISHYGDYLKEEIKICLPIFLDRLRNELTRSTTIKALTKIATSPLNIDLPIMNELIPILGATLQKNQRVLKLITLTLLNILIETHKHYMNGKLLRRLFTETFPLINSSDIHIVQVSLTLLTSIIHIDPKSMSDVFQTILPHVLDLTRSPLLRGAAMDSLLEFLKTVVTFKTPKLIYKEILKIFINSIVWEISIFNRQAFLSLAKCVAAVTLIYENQVFFLINQFMNEVVISNNEVYQVFALLTVGEIGQQIDLSSIENLKELILKNFSHVSEEIKLAASYALGHVSIGNLHHYLPFILQEIEVQPKKQYLFLNSLNEIITYHSTTPEGVQKFTPFIPDIWSLLLKHCECNEEGTRNVVAECLGKLTLIQPETLLMNLQEYLSSPSSLIRTTVVTAITFTITDQPQNIDPFLSRNLGYFLKTLQDPDVKVRRVALAVINSAAHNKPSLIKDLLHIVLPCLYNETNIRTDLIKEIELGPFKHTVDDGFDLRKAAFECMFTLVNTCLDRLDIFEFLNRIENGLKDNHDIKMLTYLILERLVQLCPNAVLHHIERIIDPIRDTCNMKVQPNLVKQEQDKQDELRKSAMRAFINLLTIPDSDKNPHVLDFLRQIKSSQFLLSIYDSLQKELPKLNETY